MNKTAEIICVGSELLLGDIVNGNARYLAQQLAKLGIAHHYQTVVGDNVTRIQRAVAIACERSRLILFTGGLGPTPDDLTLAALSEFFDAPLTERAAVVADLTEKFARRGRSLSEAGRKQALLPEGAAVLSNPIGTAPGVIWEPRNGLTVMTFPGVSWEMKAMWEQTAVPHLQASGWSSGVIHSQVLKFVGIGESDLAAKVAPWLTQENPTVATYALGGEVTLRISARAASVSAANVLIHPVADGIKSAVGTACYGQDDETLASVVGQYLKSSGQTLAVAESCTGGGLGQQITAVSGSSAYFMGGVISYDNRVKSQVLGVSDSVLQSEGAVSAPVAAAMAEGVRALLGTDWGISITGVAGPDGGTAEKPVGLVYMGLASAEKTVTVRHQFGETKRRDQIRLRSAQEALNLLRMKIIRSMD